MGFYVVIGLSLLVGTLTIMNILYIRNVHQYVDLVRRGMVRVKIRYEQDNKTKILRGWVYKIHLNSVIDSPVSYSSSFVKVYVRGNKETAVAFTMVKKIDVLNDNYLSVVFLRRAYL